MKTIKAEQFTAVITHHGEGPVWLPGRGLAVLDMLAGDIVLVAADGAVESRTHVDTVLAAVRARAGGGYVAGVERGFALLDAEFAVVETVTCWDDPSIRMNEGSCDPQGRFWCGSMAYDLTPGAGALWCLDSDRGAREMVSGIGCSNGLAWTKDGSRAYYVDSLTGRIDLLEVTEDGGAATLAPFADLAGAGFPDGIAVDTDGGVWVALFGAGEVLHIDREGHRDMSVALPVGQPTACAFGGPDHGLLYITTSRYGLDDPEPAAGAVFIAEPRIGGFPQFDHAC
ncbi:MAG TPA: SMP-30/gluconolactonase/LRE family protein [Actinokineospora sp.]|nr:SMP-30/gluconolactonase/LRE family protein [Actinokineospora sp.]